MPSHIPRQPRLSVSSSRSSYISDTNDPWDDEHVAVPSSISTFHHNDHHVGHGSQSDRDRSARPSFDNGSFQSDRESLLSDRLSGSLQHANFKFFSNEQIENAKGFTSTIENMDYHGDDENAVYDESQSSLLSGSQTGRRRHGSFYVRPPTTYGSMHSQRSSKSSSSSSSSSSSLFYNEQNRVPNDFNNGSDGNGYSDDDNSTHSFNSDNYDSNNINGDNLREILDLNKYNKLSAKDHEKLFKFHPECQVQRLYIAEEDLVVGIAGYTRVQYKVFFYYLLCVVTFGLAYLIFRWFPKWKLYLVSRKEALGKADFVAIESECGDFEIAFVKRQWYNRPLSTVLNLFSADDLFNHNVNDNNSVIDDNSSTAHNKSHLKSDDDIELPILITFDYRFFKLIYSPLEDIFKTNNNWIDKNWKNINKIKNGLSSSTHQDRLLVFGPNNCELKIKSIVELILNEALHPFYIFQIFSMALWAYDEYLSYASCIFVISLFSIASTVYETRKSSQKLSEMSHFEYTVRCYRNGFWITIPSSDLVPGDVFELSDPNLGVLPCDCVLLNGVVLVNESMLTGESVPVNKVSCDKEVMTELLYDFQGGRISPMVAKSVMFNGTKLIRTKATDNGPVVMAMCCRTGFSTTKGGLIRSMVFPSHSDNDKSGKSKDLQSDAFKYIGYMFVIAMFGFIISAINFKRLGLSNKIIIVRALDIITVVVPPALPATLTIGINFSLRRLKDKMIFCISPTKINIAGKLDVMCFDKTGTLTEDGLDVFGIQENYINKGKFSKMMSDCSSMGNNLLKICLQTCHSLNYIEGEGLVGDPLDLKMFEFTKSHFKEHSDSGFTVNKKLHVFKIFEFASHLRRMSCVVRCKKKGNTNEAHNSDETYGVVKGAPEALIDICKPGTIPHNYDTILKNYTHHGYRVIACGGKKISVNENFQPSDLSREYVERDLDFLGFIIFENKLKDKTHETLKVFQEAKIRTIMCTGDNILTAVSVSRECGLLPKGNRCFIPFINDNAESVNDLIVWEDVDDPECRLDDVTLYPTNSNGEDYNFAITGDVFRLLFKNQKPQDSGNVNGNLEQGIDKPGQGDLTEEEEMDKFLFSENYINTILLKSCIFARMSPDEKHELVEQLQKIDYCVGFCGDGANDCGALKAADIGVSLSEAEASVAAPFTSQNFQIDCCIDLIKEGRSSLVTSFSCFQYMSLYSAIQFVSITILYGQGSNLGDFQFLYIDLFLIVPLAVTMSWSKPSPDKKICAKRPSSNLVSTKIILPLLIHLFIIIGVQILPWLLVKEMPWYVRPIVGDQDTIESSDNTVLFLISCFQYVLISVILSLGPPYREPLTNNVWFILNLLVATAVNMYLVFGTSFITTGIMQLSYLSTMFKIGICVWSFMSYFLHLRIPTMFNKYFKKKISSKKYKKIIKRCANISV